MSPFRGLKKPYTIRINPAGGVTLTIRPTLDTRGKQLPAVSVADALMLAQSHAKARTREYAGLISTVADGFGHDRDMHHKYSIPRDPEGVEV